MEGCARSSEDPVYDAGMKRLQILIDEQLDVELERAALEQGTSKSGLIRAYLRERFRPLPPLASDPLFGMVGVDDYESSDVDQTIYG